MEKYTADCKLGYNRLIPRTKHYSTAPKGRRRPDNKTQGTARHYIAICEQY
jgi:hypothetical protein